MTSPNYTPDFEEHKDNPDFEFSLYSDRLHITDPSMEGLVTREGKAVVINKIETHHAHGTVDGKEQHWYHSDNQDMIDNTTYFGHIKGPLYHTFVEHADAPSKNDVMLPKNDSC